MAYPWYDSATDGVKRVDVPAPTNMNINFPIGTLLLWLAWIALFLILSVLIYFAARMFLDRGPSASVKTETGGDDSALDRIESLPFPVAVGKMNLLDEARRLYQEGQYSKAIVYLFSYQLVELDKRHLIRLTRGKTNRQYLREVGGRRPLRSLVEQTMLAFEDAFFGRRTLDQARFESCWFRVGEFDKLNAECGMINAE
jgi:hypothetical protein